MYWENLFLLSKVIHPISNMSDEEEFDSDRYDSEVDDEEKGFENDAGKRAYHNLLERKRRDNIKDSFSQLRDVLPCFRKKKKASRVQILKKSVEYIRRQPDFQLLREEMASMEEENRLLEQTIAELDEAVENNDTEAIARIQSMSMNLKRRHYLLDSDSSDSEDGDSSDEDDDSSPEPSPIAASSSRKKSKKS